MPVQNNENPTNFDAGGDILDILSLIVKLGGLLLILVAIIRLIMFLASM